MINCLGENSEGPRGGAEINIKYLCKGLRDLGHSVYWIDDNLRREVLTFKPDVIHWHNVRRSYAKYSFTDLAVVSNMNILQVMTLHDYWNFCARVDMWCDGLDKPLRVCDNRCGNMGKRLPILDKAYICAPSNTIANIYKENGFKVDEIIPHGIDLNLFRPFGNGSKKRTIYVGNKMKHKGFLVWEQIRQQLEGIETTTISDRKYDSMPQEYQNSLLVCCSNRGNEVFGYNVIEAMACGSPIIAFNSGSFGEIIVNEETGCLVNTKDEIIDKIYAVFKDEAIWDNLSKRARQEAENKYDYKQEVNSYLSVYGRKL